MARHHQQHNPSILLDALYCSEQHWESQVELEDYYQDESEEVYECSLSNTAQLNWPSIFSEHDFFWDDEELTSLLAKQHQNPLSTFLESNPLLAAARRDAVDWMLQVNAYYSFSVLTAVLAVNYLDRFLSSFYVQNGRPWMNQLAAVACLSLAAKVEETRVPLLLDLQAEQSIYVFEAKTIKRMEILVLSTLDWKMNPVTPVSFLDFIARRMGLKGYVCWDFLRKCEAILLSVITDSRFLSYLPSVLATATIMLVINRVESCPRVNQNQLLDILRIDKDTAEGCYKLMLEMEMKSSKASKKRKFGCFPRSPNGVMDASFSCDCDSSNECWALAASASSSQDALCKRGMGIVQIPPREGMCLHILCLKSNKQQEGIGREDSYHGSEY